MNWYRRIRTSIAAGALLALLVACGSAASPTPSSSSAAPSTAAASTAADASSASTSGEGASAITDLPVFEGATELENGVDTNADAIASTITQVLEPAGWQVTNTLYAPPDGATWEEIKIFYEREMSRAGWTADPSASQDTEAYKSMGWNRNQQTVVVSYGPENTELSISDFLLVTAASR